MSLVDDPIQKELKLRFYQGTLLWDQEAVLTDAGARAIYLSASP